MGMECTSLFLDPSGVIRRTILSVQRRIMDGTLRDSVGREKRLARRLTIPLDNLVLRWYKTFCLTWLQLRYTLFLDNAIHCREDYK